MPPQTIPGFLRRTAFFLSAAILVVAGCNGVARVIALRPDPRLSPSDASSHQYFGAAVAASDDRILVGAYGDASRFESGGAAYLFARSGETWAQEAKLAPTSLSRNDQFGSAVAIQDPYVLVGARGEIESRPQSGYAVFYRRFPEGWQPVKTVASLRQDSDDRFGLSVDLSGEWAVVGAHGDSERGRDAGAVYVYHVVDDAWRFHARLLAPDASEGDYFGFSLSLDGDRLVVGAFGDDDRGIRSGSAYVFRRTGVAWTFEQKLVPSDGGRHHLFGQSVALAGDTAVVGAHGHKGEGRFAGAAYVYRHGPRGWAMQDRLHAPDASANGYFGISVACSGPRVLVGARGDTQAGEQTGAAYFYALQGNRAVFQAKFVAHGAAPLDFFGRAVALAPSFGAIGAHGRDDRGSMSGAIYAF